MAKKGERLPEDKMSPEFKANIGQYSKTNSDGTGTIAQDAGKKSGEKRRERRDYKERMKSVLAVAVPDDSPVMERAKRFGLSEEELKSHSYEDAAIVSVIQNLIRRGRIKDLMDLYKLLGEYVDVQKFEGLQGDKSDLLLTPKQENE